MDIYDRILLTVFTFFNVYILWRVDQLERDKTSYEDIKTIFEMLLQKLGIHESLDYEYEDEDED
jgi:hypothetical protein